MAVYAVHIRQNLAGSLKVTPSKHTSPYGINRENQFLISFSVAFSSVFADKCISLQNIFF